jgi:hypothetical protein
MNTLPFKFSLFFYSIVIPYMAYATDQVSEVRFNKSLLSDAANVSRIRTSCLEDGKIPIIDMYWGSIHESNSTFLDLSEDVFNSSITSVVNNIKNRYPYTKLAMYKVGDSKNTNSSFRFSSSLRDSIDTLKILSKNGGNYNHKICQKSVLQAIWTCVTECNTGIDSLPAGIDKSLIKYFKFIVVATDDTSVVNRLVECDSTLLSSREFNKNAKSTILKTTMELLADILNFNKYNVIFLSTRHTLDYHQYIINRLRYYNYYGANLIKVDGLNSEGFSEIVSNHIIDNFVRRECKWKEDPSPSEKIKERGATSLAYFGNLSRNSGTNEDLAVKFDDNQTSIFRFIFNKFGQNQASNKSESTKWKKKCDLLRHWILRNNFYRDTRRQKVLIEDCRRKRNSFKNNGGNGNSFINEGNNENWFINKGSDKNAFTNNGNNGNLFMNIGSNGNSFMNIGSNGNSFMNIGSNGNSFKNEESNGNSFINERSNGNSFINERSNGNSFINERSNGNSLSNERSNKTSLMNKGVNGTALTHQSNGGVSFSSHGIDGVSFSNQGYNSPLFTSQDRDGSSFINHRNARTNFTYEWSDENLFENRENDRNSFTNETSNGSFFTNN